MHILLYAHVYAPLSVFGKSQSKKYILKVVLVTACIRPTTHFGIITLF